MPVDHGIALEPPPARPVGSERLVFVFAEAQFGPGSVYALLDSWRSVFKM